MARCPLLLLLLPPLLAAQRPPADPGWTAHTRAAPRLKLCGREFVRAVIFSCGGSRWRRGGPGAGGAFPDSDLAADGDLDQASRQWLAFALAKAPQDPSGGQPGGQGSPWVPRASRDIPTALSSYCCKQGCSKTEISRFC